MTQEEKLTIVMDKFMDLAEMARELGVSLFACAYVEGYPHTAVPCMVVPDKSGEAPAWMPKLAETIQDAANQVNARYN